MKSAAARSGFKHVSYLVPACLLLTASLLGGCKATEAPDSGFLQETHKMRPNEKTPFHRTYWNKQVDPRRYTKIVVAPVNTNYVMAQKLWEKANLINVDPERVKKDIDALAEYTRQSFTKAIAEDPNKRFTVVPERGQRTLILEVALVQIVPSKPVLNALGYAHWIPNAVSVTASTVSDSEDTGKGVVAIEGRVRDGVTGEVIGMFADRERSPVALLDLKSLTWWEPAKTIVDAWAEQLVEVANRPPGEAVKDSPSFELLVW